MSGKVISVSSEAPAGPWDVKTTGRALAAKAEDVVFVVSAGGVLVGVCGNDVSAFPGSARLKSPGLGSALGGLGSPNQSLSLE
ncbi:hypothetical protein H0H92_015644, partial [Tricholoma furcatifolium]